MSLDWIRNIVFFVVLLLAQVLVFNHVHLFGCATPLLYVYYVQSAALGHLAAVLCHGPLHRFILQYSRCGNGIDDSCRSASALSAHALRAAGQPRRPSSVDEGARHNEVCVLHDSHCADLLSCLLLFGGVQLQQLGAVAGKCRRQRTAHYIAYSRYRQLPWEVIRCAAHVFVWQQNVFKNKITQVYWSRKKALTAV